MAIHTVIAEQSWYNVCKGQSQDDTKRMMSLLSQPFLYRFGERSDLVRPQVSRGLPVACREIKDRTDL